ncbi:MAG: hypothetical protein IKS42_03145 [Oscillospiraceae bacterium]|nr:hypothetical protein [Oscillospiraceae bacterium]
MDYGMLLFSELRLVTVSKHTAPLTEENLVKAMTVNEELRAIGYTLSAGDVVTLAQSADADTLTERVRKYAGDVKAKPMYPDFPSQVMDLDEAVFRFHQLLHYFSTYGIEDLTGVPVTRGWLPEMQDTEKTESDDTLLEAKVLGLIDVSEQYLCPAERILGKTERMTDKECRIIAVCAKELSPETLAGIRVTFKQNMLMLFHAVFAAEALTSAQKLTCLHALCQHTGDVWKCMDFSLTRANYHFRTSQKRLLVKLLESYSAGDFRENLILSGKKRERTLLMLKFIDFNSYSRSKAHADAVAALRNGTLRSWESKVKEMVAQGSPEALDAYAQRPGMMLRHMTYLLRNGYAPLAVCDKLEDHADALSPQTLAGLVSFFSRPETDSLPPERFEEARNLRLITRYLLQRRLAANETALRGKKVYLNMPDFDLAHSELRIGDKSEEGGYIRSGLAYRIPDNVRCIRFFVYWNDEKRVDVDLHAAAFTADGRAITVGWNAAFKGGELIFSGDITHSDAAEYIDLDLEGGKKLLRTVSLNINLYAGYETFGEIDECFVGIMAVSKTGAAVKLYDPKNCFFTHALTGKSSQMNYGYIDVQNRLLVFDGKPKIDGDFYSACPRNGGFSLREYLDLLMQAQHAELVSCAEEADAVLVMGKPSAEHELSLIDSNFFLEG